MMLRKMRFNKVNNTKMCNKRGSKYSNKLKINLNKCSNRPNLSIIIFSSLNIVNLNNCLSKTWAICNKANFNNNNLNYLKIFNKVRSKSLNKIRIYSKVATSNQSNRASSNNHYLQFSKVKSINHHLQYSRANSNNHHLKCSRARWIYNKASSNNHNHQFNKVSFNNHRLQSSKARFSNHLLQFSKVSISNHNQQLNKASSNSQYLQFNRARFRNHQLYKIIRYNHNNLFNKANFSNLKYSRWIIPIIKIIKWMLNLVIQIALIIVTIISKIPSKIVLYNKNPTQLTYSLLIVITVCNLTSKWLILIQMIPLQR